LTFVVSSPMIPLSREEPSRGEPRGSGPRIRNRIGAQRLGGEGHPAEVHPGLSATADTNGPKEEAGDDRAIGA
jgi:hypothetical protein